MKKIIAFFALAFVLFISNDAAAFTGIAPDENSGDTVIESNETISDNVATAGNNVYIRGNINDDLFVAGNMIEIDGDVNGSLFAAGNTVKISGKIAKDAMIGANMVILEETASIGRDLFIGSNIATINAPVSRNLYIGTSKLIINNTIGGDIKANITDIDLKENAKINGNIAYTSDNELDLNPDNISGNVSFTPITANPQDNKNNNLSTLFINWILGLLKFLFIGLILVLLAPKYLEKISDIQKNKMPASLGIGFIVILLTPMAIILLLITIVGIPLAIITTALYFILIYITKILVGYFIGKAINPKLSPFLTMLLGLFIIQVIFMLPFISVIAKLFVIILGLGAFYLSISHKTITK